MKTYVFIIRRITKISGAQQYVYNKAKYLENQGWRVFVFSSLKGNILINDFRKHEQYIYPSLYFAPAYYRKSEVKDVVRRIADTVGDCQGDTCIIESDSIDRAAWAELVASRLKCRHLAFFVQERHKTNKEINHFLRFKYSRHELAGITKKSIHQMFGNEKVEEREDTYFRAYCNNVFADCEDKYSHLLDSHADLTLGSLGRIDKPCVPAIVDGICSYISHHPDKRFDVVMIGGSLLKGKAETIRKRLEVFDNVNLVLTGSVYPIPLSFAERFNVFVSTAGSAYATYREGIPTVIVNPNTGEPIGVMGLDFRINEKSMYESSNGLTVDGCIERAINEQDKIEFSSKSDMEYNKMMAVEFERQLSFVIDSLGNSYYDEKALTELRIPVFRPSAVWLTGHLLGGKGQALLMKLIKQH